MGWEIVTAVLRLTDTEHTSWKQQVTAFDLCNQSAAVCRSAHMHVMMMMMMMMNGTHHSTQHRWWGEDTGNERRLSFLLSLSLWCARPEIKQLHVGDVTAACWCWCWCCVRTWHTCRICGGNQWGNASVRPCASQQQQNVFCSLIALPPWKHDLTNGSSVCQVSTQCAENWGRHREEAAAVNFSMQQQQQPCTALCFSGNSAFIFYWRVCRSCLTETIAGACSHSRWRLDCEQTAAFHLKNRQWSRWAVGGCRWSRNILAQTHKSALTEWIWNIRLIGESNLAGGSRSLVFLDSRWEISSWILLALPFGRTKV